MIVHYFDGMHRAHALNQDEVRGLPSTKFQLSKFYWQKDGEQMDKIDLQTVGSPANKASGLTIVTSHLDALKNTVSLIKNIHSFDEKETAYHLENA